MLSRWTMMSSSCGVCHAFGCSRWRMLLQFPCLTSQNSGILVKEYALGAGTPPPRSTFHVPRFTVSSAFEGVPANGFLISASSTLGRRSGHADIQASIGRSWPRTALRCRSERAGRLGVVQIRSTSERLHHLHLSTSTVLSCEARTSTCCDHAALTQTFSPVLV